MIKIKINSIDRRLALSKASVGYYEILEANRRLKKMDDAKSCNKLEKALHLIEDVVKEIGL